MTLLSLTANNFAKLLKQEPTISPTQMDSQHSSPPQKRAKLQTDSQPKMTTIQEEAKTIQDHPTRGEHLQQSTNSKDENPKEPLNDSISNFFLPSKEESKRTPVENLEPNSSGFKSSRTGGVWQKSLEESHSARTKERSLLEHLLCPKGTQEKILESDIFRILRSEKVTGIGALYEVSPLKCVLVFRSQTEKEKLQNTAIQNHFDETYISLSFYKRGEPLRDGKEPILVTINLPAYVSDQAVKLAFSIFGEVISVLKGRHKFDRKIRYDKRHVRIFPAGGDPAILPRKISFQGGVSRDVLLAEKVVLCYRCKTRHMLGENCPAATPTLEGSDKSNSEQNETSRDSPFAGSQQKFSASEERGDVCSSAEESGDDSSSGLTSASGDDNNSERVFSVPETPMQKPVASAPQKNFANRTDMNKTHPNASTRHDPSTTLVREQFDA